MEEKTAHKCSSCRRRSKTLLRLKSSVSLQQRTAVSETDSDAHAVCSVLHHRVKSLLLAYKCAYLQKLSTAKNMKITIYVLYCYEIQRRGFELSVATWLVFPILLV